MSASVALVTGAGGELGAAIAEAIARRGATLVLTDLREGPLQGTAERVRGSAAAAITADLTAYLALDVPAYVTGAALVIDGALRA